MVSFSFPEVDWAGLILPFSYIGVILGTFFVFARVYRKRKAQKAANLQPWFPPHLQRDVYLSLLHMDSEEGSEKPKKPKKVPDSILRAALLRRAVEDINRIVKIRTAKQAIQTLQERGSVGDELWLRFQRAETEMEEELRDVVLEANGLVPNWGQYIFQTANTILNNELIRKQLAATQAKADEDRAWAAAQAGNTSTAAPTSNGDAAPAAALKEIAPASVSLDTPTTASATSSRPSTPLTGTAAPETTTSSGKKKKSKK